MKEIVFNLVANVNGKKWKCRDRRHKGAFWSLKHL